MAVPKKRTSKSRRNQRRSHDALVAVSPILCSSCGAMKRRHRACGECGEYRGRKVVEIPSASA